MKRIVDVPVQGFTVVVTTESKQEFVELIDDLLTREEELHKQLQDVYNEIDELSYYSSIEHIDIYDVEIYELEQQAKKLRLKIENIGRSIEYLYNCDVINHV